MDLDFRFLDETIELNSQVEIRSFATNQEQLSLSKNNLFFAKTSHFDELILNL